MKNFIRKITGRKFIVSILSLITGIIIALTGENDTAQTVSSACMIILPGIVYCITEGKLDLKSLENFENAIKTIQNTLNEEDVNKSDESK